MKNNVYFRLIKRLLNFKKLFYFGFLLIITLATLNALTPLIYTWAIDNIIGAKRYDLVVPFVSFFIIFVLMVAMATYLFIRTIGSLEIHFSRQLRNDLFEKIQRLHSDYFLTNDDGWIIARITSDVSKLSEVMSWQFIEIIYFAIVFFVILVLIFTYNLVLGIITIITYPILVVLIYLVRNKVLKNYRQVRAQNSVLTSKFNELISGIQTIKTIGIEKKNKEEFQRENKKMFKYSRRALIYSSLFGPITITFGYFIFAANLNASGRLYFNGAITIGMISAVMSYILMLIENTNELTAIIAEFQNAQANAERIFKLLDEPIKIEDSEEVIRKYGDVFDDVSYTPLKGEVHFKGISFGYENAHELFHNFNLTVKSGQSVALVGETGSGKSTIVNLLTRLYEPSEGQIFIDGIDIRERNINFTHHNIGHVLQSPQLFKGSIRENIRYNSGVSDERIESVVRLLGINKLIDQMPNKLETEVGESGGRLSVGEKQLISFARAIVKDPQIVIMDEATSSIDTESELLIQSATEKLLKGRTSFIIAHRLSTIKKCDLIVVLKKGQIVEKGTHESLMESRGYYYRLHQS